MKVLRNIILCLCVPIVCWVLYIAITDRSFVREPAVALWRSMRGTRLREKVMTKPARSAV